jgi:hypothetical protein
MYLYNWYTSINIPYLCKEGALELTIIITTSHPRSSNSLKALASGKAGI